MNEFLEAMKKLIEEKFDCSIHEYFYDNHHAHIAGLILQNNMVYSIRISDHSIYFYDFKKLITFDITDPKFDPETIVDIIKNKLNGHE